MAYVFIAIGAGCLFFGGVNLNEGDVVNGIFGVFVGLGNLVCGLEKMRREI